MFIGHFAVGFAAKRVAPRTALTTLVVSAIFLDVLWPMFVVLGIKNLHLGPDHTPVTRMLMRPYSHSLFMAAIWAAALALTYGAWKRYRTGAITVGVAVLSHWFLDFVSHDTDLPLAPWLPIRVGMRLGGSDAADTAIEVTMFIAGIGLYMAATRARGWTGHLSLWSLVGLLVLAYAMDLIGPPRNLETPQGVVLSALSLLLWFLWVDHSRVPRGAAGAGSGTR